MITMSTCETGGIYLLCLACVNHGGVAKCNKKIVEDDDHVVIMMMMMSTTCVVCGMYKEFYTAGPSPGVAVIFAGALLVMIPLLCW